MNEREVRLDDRDGLDVQAPPREFDELPPFAPDLELITSLERSQIPSRSRIVRLLLGSPAPKN